MGDLKSYPEHNVGAELFKTVFDQDAFGMALRAVGPRDSRWLDANDKFCEIFGYSRDEILQLTSIDISHPEEREDAVEHNRRLLSGDVKSYSREKRYVHKDGHIIWANIWLSAVYGPDGKPSMIISVIQDISERKRVEEALRESEMRLARLAATDPLTGVDNRRSFFEKGEKELRRARRYKRPVSLLMVDIDHFKNINDTHGHALGDRVLKRLAEAFRGILREQDIFGRLGGEEFAVVLVEESLAAARHVAERLRQAVDALEVENATDTCRFTISIGVYECVGEAENLGKALERADKALYTAKKDGRNRVVAGLK